MILQNVQQFGLQMRAHFRNFVQENRPLVGQFKLARLASHRSGKGALLEPEQFRFQQFSRQRGAVHFHKRLVPPLRTQVDHARDNFLADAAFPADKHRHVHRRDLQNLLPDSYHLRTRCQEAQILGHLVAVIS